MQLKIRIGISLTVWWLPRICGIPTGITHPDQEPTSFSRSLIFPPFRSYSSSNITRENPGTVKTSNSRHRYRSAIPANLTREKHLITQKRLLGIISTKNLPSRQASQALSVLSYYAGKPPSQAMIWIQNSPRRQSTQYSLVTICHALMILWSTPCLIWLLKEGSFFCVA